MVTFVLDILPGPVVFTCTWFKAEFSFLALINTKCAVYLFISHLTWPQFRTLYHSVVYIDQSFTNHRGSFVHICSSLYSPQTCSQKCGDGCVSFILLLSFLHFGVWNMLANQDQVGVSMSMYTLLALCNNQTLVWIVKGITSGVEMLVKLWPKYQVYLFTEAIYHVQAVCI